MLKKRLVITLIYIFLALDSLGVGSLSLFAPVWSQHQYLSWVVAASPALVRLWACGLLLQAPLLLWCARHLRQRMPIHWSLTAFALAQILVAWTTTPRGGWLPLTLLQLFVPALLLLLLALPPLPLRPRGPREQGVVKWFNATKGFGFITRAGGEDVFVHYRNIRGEGHRTLREGQRVSFVVVAGEKGLQADDVQAIG